MYIEFVVLEDGLSYLEKEILEGVTEVDIVVGDIVIFFRIFFFEYDDLFFSITDFMCVWGLSFGIIICCDWSSCIRVFFDWLVNFV